MKFSLVRPAMRIAPLGLLMLLAACETPLNMVRAQRFADTPVAQPVEVKPRALALALQVAPGENALTPASLQQANQLLASQGRLSLQVLSITPLRAGSQETANRLAQALIRAGAQSVTVQTVPADAERLAEAERNNWDLELQSEAVVADIARCTVANADAWTIHPYRAVGSLGCANRANIARMASDPRDLVRPRTLAPGDGRVAAGAIERYQKGEIRDLIDINFDD